MAQTIDAKPAEAKPLLYGPRQTAKLLDVSDRTLWALTKAGKIACVKIGALNKYTPADIEAFIERSRVSA